MSRSPRFALLIVLALVAGLVAWLASRPAPAQSLEAPAAGEEPGDALMALASRADEAPATRSAVASAPARVPATTATDDPEAGPLLAYPADRAWVSLSGVVVDALGIGLAGAQVRLQAASGALYAGLEIADDRAFDRTLRAGGDGGFRFDGVPVGPYRLSGVSADGKLRGVRHCAVAAPSARERLELDSSLSAEVEFRVFEPGVPAAGARPAASARIALHLSRADRASIAADREPDVAATTDDKGTFIWRPARVVPVVVTVQTMTGLTGRMVVTREHLERGRRFVIDVARAGRIVGRLVGAPPERLSATRVLGHLLSNGSQAYYSNFGLTLSAAVDGEGRFAFADLPPGSYTFTLGGESGLRLVLPAVEMGGPLANSVTPPFVAVAAGQTRAIELTVAPGGVIEGVVRRPDGNAVAGARVAAVLAPRTSNFTDGFVLHGAHVWRLDDAMGVDRRHPLIQVTGRTDAAGGYALAGLQPGQHRVEVLAAGYAYDRRMDVVVGAGAVTRLEHVVEPAGVLQGVVDGTYFGVVRAGESRPRMLAILPASGAFTFPGMAAGVWTVGLYHSDASEGFVPLADVRIDTGRTTWVDLRNAGLVRIAGRLVAGEPIPPDTTVSLLGHRAPVGADGTFVVRLARPPQFVGGREIVVAIGGFTWKVPLPESISGAREWSGDVVLGEGSVDLLTLDRDGRPAPMAVTMEGQGLMQGAARSGADGRLRVSFLPPGEYVASARPAGGVGASVGFTSPGATPITLRCRASAHVAVQVVDAGGRPATGVRVAVWIWKGPGAPPADAAEFGRNAESFSRWVDSDGRVELDVVAGVAHVTAIAGWGRSVPAEERRLVLEPGQTESMTLRLR